VVVREAFQANDAAALDDHRPPPDFEKPSKIKKRGIIKFEVFSESRGLTGLSCISSSGFSVILIV
jgi:hypothetical protein